MLIWVCKYCNNTIESKNAKSKGAHLTNCPSNPKRIETIDKITTSKLVERILIIKKCLKCEITFEQLKTQKQIEYGRDVRVFCSKSCANSHEVSDKQKADISASLTGRTYPEYQKREYRFCKICNSKFECHLSSKKLNCGKEYCKKKYASESLKGKTGGWRPKKTHIYNGIRLDSTWEVAFAIRLDQLNIKWISTSKDRFFDYINLEGNIKKYHPDFYLEKYDLHIEIKGAWTKSVIQKMKSVQERHNINLLIIDNMNDILNFKI